VAVKVDDGSSRAAPPALLRALSILGVLDAAAADGLARWVRPPVLGGGEAVGSVEAAFDLSTG
jgi:hypothetical protein